MHSLITGLIVLFLACSPIPATSQDTDYSEFSLEQLLNTNVKVETASKKAEGLNDAPGIISLVTALEIRQFGANNLKEILNRVTSIYMLSTYYGFNNFTSIRGDSQSHYDNHTLILLNGRPFRNSLFGGLNGDIYSGFPTNIIQRMEVIRGPGSVLYGAGAYSGVINIITHSERNGTSIEAGIGSFGRQTGKVVTRGYEKGLTYMAAATYEESDGWDFNVVDEANIPINIPLPEKHTSFSTTLAFHDFSFSGLYLESDQIYWGTTPNGSGAMRASQRLFGNLGWEKALTDTWTLEANITYNDLNVDPDVSTTKTKETLYEITAFFSPNEKTNIIIGGSSVQAKGEWSTAFISPYARNDLSAYFQVDYKPRQNLKLIAGGQLNKPDSNSSDFVPRIAAIFQFNEQQGFKLLHGEAFRSPASNELDFNTTIILGNPDLSPEKVATTELQFFTRGTSWWFNATAFNIEQKDLVGRKLNPSADSFLIYDNLGTGNFKGLELEGKIAKNERLSLSFGYSYQGNENDQGQDDFTLMPNHLLKMGLYLKLAPGAELSLFDNYSSKPPDVNKFNPNRNAYNPTADAAHLVSANLNFNLKDLFNIPVKNFTLSVYGTNLLDEEIFINEFVRRVINTLPLEAGRSVSASLKVKF